MTSTCAERDDSTRTGSIRWDSSWPESATAADRDRLLGYLEERFGIPTALFRGYRLLGQGKSWFLIRESIPLAAVSHFKAVQAGLKAFRRVGAFVKPSTRMIQVFGRGAQRCRVEIDTRQLRTLWQGEHLDVSLPHDKGYVILELPGERILGLGFYHDGRLTSQIRRRELRAEMLQNANRRK